MFIHLIEMHIIILNHQTLIYENYDIFQETPTISSGKLLPEYNVTI